MTRAGAGAPSLVVGSCSGNQRTDRCEGGCGRDRIVSLELGGRQLCEDCSLGEGVTDAARKHG